MKTKLYFFTGTGNSLVAARRLADLLGNAGLVSLAQPDTGLPTGSIPEGEKIGIIFPVYIWGVPARVLRFLDLLAGSRPSYIFAVAVNAGQVAGTLLELDRALKERNLSLSSGFSLEMPSNYIAWGGPGPREKIDKTFASASQKLELIAETVREGRVLPPEKGPLWQRILFTRIHKLSAPHIPTMDKKFFADETCTSCGICAEVCPSGNITFEDTGPLWNHRCEQCFACIQWCPEEAIQFGEKTRGRPRYRHPEVSLEDIIASRT
jgi:ferredoxin